MTYKPLEPIFTKVGFRFKQIVREGDLAIFHKTHLSPAHDGGFEVVIIGRHDGYEIAGNKIEPAETYPSNEQWGVKGWTYADLYHAELKFESLKNGGKMPVEVETPEPVETEAVAPIEEPAPRQRQSRGEKRTLLIPVGEFSTDDLAKANAISYPIAYIGLKELVSEGQVKFAKEERLGNAKRPTKFYVKA